MSDLLGAVSLSGRSIAKLLDRDTRRAMLAFLPGYPEHVTEFERDGIWLCGPSDKVVQDGEWCLAAEGWLGPGTEGSRTAAAALAAAKAGKGGALALEGQYALACADSIKGALTLVRSPSGGERLYYARTGELVLFAASVKPLLGCTLLSPKLNMSVVNEVLLTGLPNFGCGTLFEGVDEVLPGHALGISGGVGRQEWCFGRALASREGPPERLAQEFRQSLNDAVQRAIGSQRPVAIALSGGIDSSAIAAAAVEAVGSDSVHAFTWEFDDHGHSTETHYAEEVARHLGIRHHHIFKLSLQDFLDGIPEVVWRSEGFVQWPKSFLLPVARYIRDAGFDQYLTGFGIGSHMGYLDEFARVLQWLPFSNVLLRYWQLARFGNWRRLDRLAGIHPGLEPPHPRLYYMLLRLLQHTGHVRNIAGFYPPEMRIMVENLHGAAEFEDETLPLGRRLQLHAFAHLISCIDITRSEKSTREATGIHRVSPAHFPSCIPYAYFPVRPPPFVWSRDRDKRPGKLLLQLAYRGVLPDSVLFRKKSWDDAVASRSWIREGRTLMLHAVPDFPENLRDIDRGYPDAVRFWEPRSINATGLGFAFWRKIFLERSLANEPPVWEELFPFRG